MPLRITTWNVNGIRNPFSYQPWRDKRTFEGMFDVLEADIVCFQETKIQRKDLRDDMVLVPGWDCYFSLPKHKKGYSGVVIYTRNSVCAPIRAEEGITGCLTLPNSTTSFRDLPEDEQIGGYPSAAQLGLSEVDAVTLDSEGRCVILEFPGFVLMGTYCPAARDETRDGFRLGFLNLLDARIRNLVAMGKRIIWTGDLNISRSELDTASAEETMRKHGMAGQEYVSTPARRLFNQILVGGKVFGERDEGRERPIMWDVTRAFHEGRKGMFTCWETKINARPGNYGSRIDYVLCSVDMKDWFCASDIQEGLLGSDHCPVFAELKDKVVVDGQEIHILDLVNPPGMVVGGQRKVEWSSNNLLPMSGKMIAEFDRRRNIRDMFSRKPSLSTSKSSADIERTMEEQNQLLSPAETTLSRTPTTTSLQSNPEVFPKAQEQYPTSIEPKSSTKRVAKSEASIPVTKRTKSALQTPGTDGPGKGQKSLKGFFRAKSSTINGFAGGNEEDVKSSPETAVDSSEEPLSNDTPPFASSFKDSSITNGTSLVPISPAKPGPVDTSSSAKSWGQLFTKPVAPMCEHDEPCKTMLTRKTGINCGRSFWMCARPLGPSGNKEKGTQWRCSTFIWASDWSGGKG